MLNPKGPSLVARAFYGTISTDTQTWVTGTHLRWSQGLSFERPVDFSGTNMEKPVIDGDLGLTDVVPPRVVINTGKLLLSLHVVNLTHFPDHMKRNTTLRAWAAAQVLKHSYENSKPTYFSG